MQSESAGWSKTVRTSQLALDAHDSRYQVALCEFSYAFVDATRSQTGYLGDERGRDDFVVLAAHLNGCQYAELIAREVAQVCRVELDFSHEIWMKKCRRSAGKSSISSFSIRSVVFRRSQSAHLHICDCVAIVIRPSFSRSRFLLLANDFTCRLPRFWHLSEQAHLHTIHHGTENTPRCVQPDLWIARR